MIRNNSRDVNVQSLHLSFRDFVLLRESFIRPPLPLSDSGLLHSGASLGTLDALCSSSRGLQELQ